MVFLQRKKIIQMLFLLHYKNIYLHYMVGNRFSCCRACFWGTSRCDFSILLLIIFSLCPSRVAFPALIRSSLILVLALEDFHLKKYIILSLFINIFIIIMIIMIIIFIYLFLFNKLQLKRVFKTKLNKFLTSYKCKKK